MKVVARETLVFDTEENSLTESAKKKKWREYLLYKEGNGNILVD